MHNEYLPMIGHEYIEINFQESCCLCQIYRSTCIEMMKYESEPSHIDNSQFKKHVMMLSITEYVLNNIHSLGSCPIDSCNKSHNIKTSHRMDVTDCRSKFCAYGTLKQTTSALLNTSITMWDSWLHDEYYERNRHLLSRYYSVDKDCFTEEKWVIFYGYVQ